LLGHPRRARVAGAAGDEDPARVDLEEEEHVQGLQPAQGRQGRPAGPAGPARPARIEPVVADLERVQLRQAGAA